MYKKYLFFISILIVVALSCSKEYSKNGKGNAVTVSPACKPAPLLTGRVWVGDTMLIDSPNTYSQLLPYIDFAYVELERLKTRQLVFKNNCQVSQINPKSDWDNFTAQWALVNNDKDITILHPDNSTLTLYNWKVNGSTLSYSKKYQSGSLNYSITFVYK